MEDGLEVGGGEGEDFLDGARLDSDGANLTRLNAPRRRK